MRGYGYAGLTGIHERAKWRHVEVWHPVPRKRYTVLSGLYLTDKATCFR